MYESGLNPKLDCPPLPWSASTYATGSETDTSIPECIGLLGR